jgi:hypothetical protein
MAGLLSLFALPVFATFIEAEEELKSATVLSFLRYATWPGLKPGQAITVGVLGRSSFVSALGGLLERKSINGRSVRLIEFKAASEVRKCELMYFATDRKADIQEALQSLPSARVLTMGETDHFLEYGGAINLLLIDGHMGFEVSMDALERSAVDISSKLLRLGQLRRRRAP